MKKLFVGVSIMLCMSTAKAYEVRPVVAQPKLDHIRVVMSELRIEKVEDCNYPSSKDNCRIDEHGHEHCAVVQNVRCE